MLYHLLHVGKLTDLHMSHGQSINNGGDRGDSRHSEKMIAHVDHWLASVVVPLAAAVFAIRTRRERRVCSRCAWLSGRAVASLPAVIHPASQSGGDTISTSTTLQTSSDSSDPIHEDVAAKRDVLTISSRNLAMPASSVFRSPCVSYRRRPSSGSP